MQPDGKRLDRRLLAAAVTWALFTAAFGSGVGLRVGGVRLAEWVDDLGKAGAALLAAIACAGAAYRHGARFRVAWGLVGASAFSWFCGDGVRSYYELGLGRHVPFPSPADAGFLGALPLAVAGLLFFAVIPSPNMSTKRQSGIPRLAFPILLDGVIIAGSLLAVSWATVLEPVVRAASDSLFSSVISIAYPVSDVVMLTTLVLLVSRRINAPGLLLLASGFLAILLADSSSGYLTATNADGPGLPVDTGWVAGYLLVALAGFRSWLTPVSRADSHDRRMSRWRLLLPYLAVTGAVSAAVTDRVRTGSVDDLMFADLVVVVVLIALRQFLMLAENVGLNTALKDQTAALQKREEQLRSLVEHSSDAATLANSDGVIQFQSGSVQRMFAYVPGELVGTRLIDLVFPADRPAVLNCLSDALKASARPISVTGRLRHKLGTWTDCELTITNLLYLPSVEALVINVRDISDRKRLEQKVMHQAGHDALTNLANRTTFRRALEQAVDGSQRSSILIIDVDDFKTVNAALGSDAGDQLLVAVGARLEQNTPKGALLARLRSDEFAFLLPATPIEDAATIADGVLQQFHAPFRAGDQEIALPVSIGGAGVISGRETATDLLRNADLALEVAKAKGKAQYQRYEPGIRPPDRARAA